MRANTIYTASRVRHSAIWKEAKEKGFNIISTWIYEAGEGETDCMENLWQRCVNEAKSADVLILYREDGEMLKGALVEAGAALSAGKMVFAVGFNDPEDEKTFSFLRHPNVSLCATLESAFHFIASNNLSEGEIETLKSGAKQSKIAVNYFDLFPNALRVAAAVRAHGVATYGPNNHLGIPPEDSLNHAIAHIYDFAMEKQSEHGLTTDEPYEHLGHAACRVLMALDCILAEKEKR